MKRIAILGFAVLAAACGGDDEKIPPRIDAAPIDGPPSIDAPAAIDAPDSTDAAVDAAEPDAPVDAAPDAPVDAAPDAANEVNGCNAAMIVDATAVGATRTITFPGFAYTPKCLRIAVGQTVTFSGSFTSHPLRAGAVVGGVAMPASGSPIASTDGGTSASFTFPAAGVYPYYCAVHGLGGMTGVVYVE